MNPSPASNVRRITLPLRERSRLIGSYTRNKIGEQVPSVLFISGYLILFQTLILGLPLTNALILAAGLCLVILGLAFFLEGLALGLMPLGETIGLKLPRKAALPLVLVFAFLLGIGASLAEPAVGALKVAGSSVKAWEAPLLFLLLNKYANHLVIAIGLGVGISVILGVLRFYYNWSLKPLIFSLFGVILSVSVAAWFDPRLVAVTGLAWDCGGIVTGPVTVPLVLALGLGISRTIGKNDSPLSGFGVVTLASAVPIVTVMALGIILLPACPKPMSALDFARAESAQAQTLFADQDAYKAYAIAHNDALTRLALFDYDRQSRDEWYARLDREPALRSGQFPAEPKGFQRWLAKYGSEDEQLAFFGNPEDLARTRQELLGSASATDLVGSLGNAALNATQAVLPLCLFLLLTLLVLIRQRLARPDEVIFGIAITLVGMFMLNAGIEFGLSRLGNSVGQALPSAIKAIDLPENTRVIPDFDSSLIYHAIEPDGSQRAFFYLHQGGRTIEVPYEPSHHNQDTRSYELLPQRGPLMGHQNEALGIALIVVFAFIMGTASALAEPTLITVGRTVEEITVGIFRQKHLMQAVAVGVGIGIAWGVLKIVWDLPLIWLLAPPYAALLVMTAVSDESYVNIAWDSAGAATGPVTVPLVLAMGIGLSEQMGVVEGFGILALASAWPILVVLSLGLVLKHRQRQEIKAVETGTES